jgi:hypothetical protein
MTPAEVSQDKQTCPGGASVQCPVGGTRDVNRCINVLVATGLISMLCGCASIIGKSVYPVAIQSNPGPAKITIVNRDGKEVFQGQTPTTVSLKAGAGFFRGEDYTVTFEKPGYETKKSKIKRGISGWYLGGNFFLGGLVGWLVVDPATGAMWTLKDLDTTLTPQQANKTPDQKLQITTLDEIPQNLRSKMVRVDSGTGP